MSEFQVERPDKRFATVFDTIAVFVKFKKIPVCVPPKLTDPNQSFPSYFPRSSQSTGVRYN